MKKFLEEAAVTANGPVTDTVYKLDCRAPQVAAAALPGQFVNIALTGRNTFYAVPSALPVFLLKPVKSQLFTASSARERRIWRSCGPVTAFL